MVYATGRSLHAVRGRGGWAPRTPAERNAGSRGTTWKSWIFGRLLRVLTQVNFFALIGKLIAQSEQPRFLVLGNGLMTSAVEAMMVVASSTWERDAFRDSKRWTPERAAAFANLVGRQFRKAVKVTDVEILIRVSLRWRVGSAIADAHSTSRWIGLPAGGLLGIVDRSDVRGVLVNKCAPRGTSTRASPVRAT